MFLFRRRRQKKKTMNILEGVRGSAWKPVEGVPVYVRFLESKHNVWQVMEALGSERRSLEASEEALVEGSGEALLGASTEAHTGTIGGSLQSHPRFPPLPWKKQVEASTEVMGFSMEVVESSSKTCRASFHGSAHVLLRKQLPWKLLWKQ